MSRQQKRQFVNLVVLAIVVFVLGIVFIPMFEISTEAVTNETVWFKVHDWFTQLKTNINNYATLYLLFVSFIASLIYFKRYIKVK